MPSEAVYFQCQRCTNCCRWAGDVVVSDAEIKSISTFLGIPESELIDNYTALRADRRGLTIIEKPGTTECIFLEGNDCRINDVKPQQCRDFPNKWNFPGWRQVCEAIPIPLSKA